MIAGLAPRTVTLAGTVDGAGKRVDAKQVGEIYPATGNFRILERADWSLEALVG